MRSNLKAAFASALCIAAFSGQTFAEGKVAGSGPNPFTDCGIGAALFPNSNVGAVISNVIWDVGTTAVTSATASPETCEGGDAQTAAFILETYDQLVEETAVGEGQYFATLLNMVDTDTENQQAIASQVRTSMASLLASESYLEMSKLEKSSAYYDVLMGAALNS